MAGRKIKDEAEAITALESMARTGLELGEWCRARDVDARSLAGWRQVLTARGGEPPEAIRFVEVALATESGDEPSARYSVHHGDFRVEIDGAFDDAVLIRLLRVVAAC